MVMRSARGARAGATRLRGHVSARAQGERTVVAHTTTTGSPARGPAGAPTQLCRGHVVVVVRQTQGGIDVGIRQWRE